MLGLKLNHVSKRGQCWVCPRVPVGVNMVILAQFCDEVPIAPTTRISWNYDFKWPNYLEGQGQCLTSPIPAEKIPRHIFGAHLVILAQIDDKLSCRQAQFPRIPRVKMAKMTLKVRSTTPIFHSSWNYPRMHVWCKFGDSSRIRDELSCGQLKFRDGQTDGHTYRHRQRQYSPNIYLRSCV